MKDLEIRGAGDILGGEQSGFINDIGFETYQKILSEAVNELKNSEFKRLFKDDQIDESTTEETIIDSDLEILFPTSSSATASQTGAAQVPLPLQRAAAP